MAAAISRFPRRDKTSRQEVLEREATRYFGRRVSVLRKRERALMRAMIMFLEEGREDDLVEICRSVEAILSRRHK